MPAPCPSPKSTDQVTKPHLALRILKSKKTPCIIAVSAVYTPYLIYFPLYNPTFPLWLTIFSYIPIYFLTGFFGGGIYYLNKWHSIQKEKENKKQEKEEEKSKADQGPFTTDDFNLQDFEHAKTDISHTPAISPPLEPEIAILKPGPRRLPQIFRFPSTMWKPHRSEIGHQHEHGEVLWDAEDFERTSKFPIVDNSQVVERRRMEGFEDVDLGSTATVTRDRV